MTSNLLTANDIAKLNYPKEDFRIKYGSDDLQFGDLRLPRGKGPHTVIAVIHGGCWSKDYDIKHIGQFADAIRKLGFATWTLEYRRVGNKGGGWPGTFIDISTGIDHLRKVEKEHNLNLDKTFVVGHSSGGHFALWLGARVKISEKSALFVKNPIQVKGIIAIAGAPDLPKAHAQKVCGDAIDKLMGGSPQQFPNRYKDATPNLLLPTEIPQVVIYGEHDKYKKFSEDYFADAQRAGQKIKKVVAENSGHFEVIVPSSSKTTWELVKREIESLVAKKL